MDNSLIPSFPRRRESSKKNNPHSGQCLGVESLREIFSQLDSRLRENDEILGQMNYPGISQ
jgi:hypothetical protein